MLIILVRVAFVLLAVLIGLTSGNYFYQTWADGLPGWFGGAMGFAVAVTLIAGEHAFRRRFTRSLVAFLIGLGAGLLLSILLLSVLELVLQDEQLRNNIDIPLALVTTYLVMVTVLRNADRFRVVVPFVEFRSDAVVEGTAVLDGAALTDGRLLGLVEAGLLDQRVLIPRSLVSGVEAEATSDNDAAKLRGQRALEVLAELRQSLGDRLLIDETEIPQAKTIGDVVVGLARLEGARIITADRDLRERARAEGLRLLDLNLLAKRLSTALRPGQTIELTIEKAGEEAGQGIGYLDDGSMAVVTGGGDHVGERVPCTVLRLHQTANGRMVFAETRPAAESHRQVSGRFANQ